MRYGEAAVNWQSGAGIGALATGLAGLTQFLDKRSGVLVLIPDAMVGRLPADGVLELEAPPSAPPAVRGQQPTQEEREARHADYLATACQHPTLIDDPDLMGRIVGVHPGTIRRWSAQQRRKFQENVSRGVDED